MKNLIKPLCIALLCVVPFLCGKTFVPVFAESPIESLEMESLER